MKMNSRIIYILFFFSGISLVFVSQNSDLAAKQFNAKVDKII